MSPTGEPSLAASSTTSNKPSGELALQTLSMPKDTNANGDIFGGWLVSQMDLAAGIATKKISRGRAATVAIQSVNFLHPVSVGSTVSCYTQVIKTGRSSMHISVEVWMSLFTEELSFMKVADGVFVFVAIDENGNPRALPKQTE